MRIADCGGKFGDHLRLGHETLTTLTKEEQAEAIRDKATHWAPRKAKSYTIVGADRNDTGYIFWIAYFTTVHEGVTPISQKKED